ncbi:MAG: tRNA guanosine(34) transglycosylase Tgt [Defluviitaleaceae bacterium]|nr:tRNA guanosine(34) transglycosylase Tgt [Defluviitaleaceae bacterium]
MILSLNHGDVQLPAFFPDATRGVVRTIDAQDLDKCHIPGLVMNAYHLLSKPGPSTIKALGGLHAFSGWQKPILTDSGGFQVFSLIRENEKFGEIRRSEIIFRPDGKKGKKVSITPEKCIQAQFAYGSDIIMCLDYCTHPDDPPEINRLSVDITIDWARRCKDEYNRLVVNSQHKPLIFGIIQGGSDLAVRKECAEALIEIGFDGFGFGGWPLDSSGKLTEDILAYTASLMPDNTPKYAMGVGRPEGIVACLKMGYNLFDCVIPTREARHNRLYVFNQEFYEYFYPLDDIYRRDPRPISDLCDCHTCQNYSRGYLRHLLAIGDSLGHRLATIHNLRFYTMLMERYNHIN